MVKRLCILLIILICCELTEAQKIVNLLHYGAKGDGIADDSKALATALKNCEDGSILTGNKRTFKIASPISISLKSMYLRDLNIVLSNVYTNKEYINIECNDVTLEDIKIDGGRGTYKKGFEQWSVFANENNIESITPMSPDLFKFVGLRQDAKFKIKNLTASNLHASSCLTIITYGNVLLENIVFRNLSNKTFHVYHSIDDGRTVKGKTIVNVAKATDVGILPSIIIVNKKLYKTNAYKYMPQASFNFIVSFGSYYAKNIVVNNYGSCGLTSDRNIDFMGDSIFIFNNTEKTFSNNPSGGLWLEASKNVIIKNAFINISKRNTVDKTYDNSALHIFGKNSKINISDFTIYSNSSNSYLNKGIRGSFYGNNTVYINNLQLYGLYKTAGVGFDIWDDLRTNSTQVNFNNVKTDTENWYFSDNYQLSIDKFVSLNNKLKFNYKLSNKKPKSYINITNDNIKNIVVSSKTETTKIERLNERKIETIK